MFPYTRSCSAYPVVNSVCNVSLIHPGAREDNVVFPLASKMGTALLLPCSTEVAAYQPIHTEYTEGCSNTNKALCQLHGS